MGHFSAHAVRDLIIDRLVTGTYPVGTRLPTSRALAEEIGAHRNTVAKAYQLLAQVGLVTMRQGRGTYVVSVGDEGNGNSNGLLSHLQQQLSDQIMKARRLGIPEEELRELIDQQITATYDHARRGIFVECNVGDMDAAVSEIESLTGHRLTPLLIEQLKANPAKEVAGYDLVVTILPHIKEVSEYVESSGLEIDIVGVYTQPDEEALGEIARIEPGSRVGIVVDYPEGVARFVNRINSVTTVETSALVSPTNDEIRELSATVDYLVCNRSRAKQVMNLDLSIPVIVLSFHVSRQSLTRVTDALVTSRPLLPAAEQVLG
jgi:DNA-binding transcriptional regulator YhcF (GntR family)